MLKATEFGKMFGIALDDCYRRLKVAVNKLITAPITIYDLSPNGKLRTTKYPWFSRLRYDTEGNSEVEIVFNEHIRPYLYELQGHFTILQFDQLAKLDTPFSFRLYSWLNQGRLLDKYQTHDGWRITLSVDWMRERSGLGKAYQNNYKEFKRRLIEPAISQLNLKTDLEVSYVPIRAGRRITALEFSCKSKIAQKQLPSAPVRPRLPRRPHVSKGTHEEGIWARNCIELLLNYRETLKPFDKCLSLADLRKLVSYYQLIGDQLNADKVQASIDKRQTKKAA